MLKSSCKYVAHSSFPLSCLTASATIESHHIFTFLGIYSFVCVILCVCVCVCVYSNSRNDVPRVAQRYGTIAAHTRRHASVLVLFVVFCVHMYSFAGLIGGRHHRRSVTLQSPTATLISLFPAQSSLGADILV